MENERTDAPLHSRARQEKKKALVLQLALIDFFFLLYLTGAAGKALYICSFSVSH